jgi:adenylate cyclase class 2
MNLKDQEVEVKFFVTRLDQIEQRIRELGGELVQPRTLEVNLRFDTSENDLERGFRVLRLRKDTRSRLTYKGPGEIQQGVRTRQEIEFEVSDFDSATAFLLALGYRVSMIYEKYRAAYHFMGTEIALDELPYGSFVEIEGADSPAIQAVNDRLGLDWQASVPTSYTGLFESLRQRKQLPFRDLSFENFAGFPITPELLGVRPADAGQMTP